MASGEESAISVALAHNLHVPQLACFGFRDQPLCNHVWKWVARRWVWFRLSTNTKMDCLGTTDSDALSFAAAAPVMMLVCFLRRAARLRVVCRHVIAGKLRTICQGRRLIRCVGQGLKSLNWSDQRNGCVRGHRVSRRRPRRTP